MLELKPSRIELKPEDKEEVSRLPLEHHVTYLTFKYFSYPYPAIFNTFFISYSSNQYEAIKAERAAQQQTTPPPSWQQPGPSTKKPTAAHRIGLTQPGRGQQ